MSAKELLKKLPAVGRVLERPEVVQVLQEEQLARELVAGAAREVLDGLRRSWPRHGGTA